MISALFGGEVCCILLLLLAPDALLIGKAERLDDWPAMYCQDSLEQFQAWR